MIEARELTRRYGSLLAVDRVSFDVSPGQIVGLLGPNGAGKTTILRILAGYHFPHEGVALIDGFDVVTEPIEAKRRLGYLPEHAPAYGELSVSEYLGFICGARSLGRAAARRAIERVVTLCALESVWRRPIAQLSKGFQQRVGLAQALVHDPQVVVLDEPTSGLDPNQIREVRRIVRELGEDRTVLFSTHIMREAEAVCARVLILDAGRIVAGGTALNSGVNPAPWQATIYPGPQDNFVFNASTIFWCQGLSSPPGHMLPWSHWSRPHGPDRRVQQITRNLLDRSLRAAKA